MMTTKGKSPGKSPGANGKNESPTLTTGYGGPELLGAPITIKAATEYLSQKYGVRVTDLTVRKACALYRRRMEGRENDTDPIDPQRAAQEDPNPRPRELKCIWFETRRTSYGLTPKFYLVDSGSDNLDHLELNLPVPGTGAPASGVSRFARAERAKRKGLPPGRKVGSSGIPRTTGRSGPVKRSAQGSDADHE